eukprot:4643542-Heterocapsa_arctica.AAC.1
MPQASFSVKLGLRSTSGRRKCSLPTVMMASSVACCYLPSVARGSGRCGISAPAGRSRQGLRHNVRVEVLADDDVVSWMPQASFSVKHGLGSTSGHRKRSLPT